MPIGYEYDSENKLLTCNIGEELVIVELVEYLRAARTDDRIEPATIEIVSLDQLRDFLIRAQDIRDVEPELGEFVANRNILGSVFLGESPLQMGIGRMLSGLVTTMFPNYPAPVVRDRDEVLREVEWIRGPMREDAPGSEEFS